MENMVCVFYVDLVHHVSALAMLGSDVVSTDQKEVLPLLKRNVEWNTSTILQMNTGSGLLSIMSFLSFHLSFFLVSTAFLRFVRILSCPVTRNYWMVSLVSFLVASFGSLRVAELDWGNEDHIRAVEPPFDYVIGTDVVS